MGPRTTGDPRWSRRMKEKDTFVRAFASQHLWDLKFTDGDTSVGSLSGMGDSQPHQWAHGPWRSPSRNVSFVYPNQIHSKGGPFGAVMSVRAWGSQALAATMSGSKQININRHLGPQYKPKLSGEFFSKVGSGFSLHYYIYFFFHFHAYYYDWPPGRYSAKNRETMRKAL